MNKYVILINSVNNKTVIIVCSEIAKNIFKKHSTCIYEKLFMM